MLELIEETIKTDSILPLEQVRSVFECQVTVPEDLPGMKKVLTARGTVEPAEEEDSTPSAQTLRLLYRILYIADNENEDLMSFTAESRQTLGLNLPQAAEDGELMLTAFAEHTDFTAEGDRRLLLRSVVRAEPKLFFRENKKAAVGIEGPEDLQIRHGVLPLTSVKKLPELMTEISEELELPAGKRPIGRLLQTDAHITDLSVSTEEQSAILKGTLSVCTLYLAEEAAASPEIWENRIPFTANIELPSPDAEIVFRNCRVRDLTATAKEDSDGELRVLKLDAIIETASAYSEDQETRVVLDAFSLSKVLNFTREPLKMARLVSGVSDQFVLKDIIQKPEEAPGIAEVINVSGAVGHTDVEVLPGRISIDGFVACSVLYLSGDPQQPIAAFDLEIPFAQNINEPQAGNGLFSALETEVTHISFCIISPEEIELRIALRANGTLMRTDVCEIITQISGETPQDRPEENRPSILLYIVQPGDTLWQIAKKYSVSPEILQTLNNIKNPDQLLPGQKLVIA